MSSINKLKTIMVTLLTCAAFSAGAATQAEEPKESPLCSDTLNSAMGFLSAIPFVGDGVSTLAQTVQKASCPNGTDELKDYMANKFAKVDVELENINKKLNDLSNQMNAMNQNINIKALKAQQKDVYQHDSDFASWLGQYQFALATFNGKDGKPYNSITDLVNSYGTFDKAISSLPGLKGVLDQLYNTDSEFTAISKLGNPANFDLDAIVGLCKDSSTISGDVFSLRNICNTASVAMYAKNIMLEKQVEYAYNDISKVYNIDTRKDKVTLYQINKSLFTGWVNSAEQMNPRKAIIPQIKSTEAIYALAKNLEAKGFKLTGWFTAPDKRYLTVEYLIRSTPYKSKYAYQQPTRDGSTINYGNNAIDDKIVNVMGVPVPERYFTKNADSSAFPYGMYDDHDTSTRGNHIGNPSTFLVASNFSLSVFGKLENLSVDYNKNGMISSNSGDDDGHRKTFILSADSDKDYPSRLVYKLSFSDNDLALSSAYYSITFMRYTYTDGFNYVFAMQSGGINNKLGAYTQCITNDCTVERSDGTLGKIKFQNGPTEVYWGLTGTSSKWDLTVK